MSSKTLKRVKLVLLMQNLILHSDAVPTNIYSVCIEVLYRISPWNTYNQLEMCQYDSDAPAQGHPQPHVGILQKMKLKKGTNQSFLKTILERKTSFESEKGP